MIQLNRNHYLLLDYHNEIFTSYDDVNRLIGWLIGKPHGHRVVLVVKGDKAKLLTIPSDLLGFRDVLLTTMNGL